MKNREFNIGVIFGLVLWMPGCWEFGKIHADLKDIKFQMSQPIELKQPIVVQSVKLDLSQPASMVSDSLLPAPPKAVPPKDKSDKGGRKR